MLRCAIGVTTMKTQLSVSLQCSVYWAAHQFNLFSRSSVYYPASFTPSQSVNRGCITRKKRRTIEEVEASRETEKNPITWSAFCELHRISYKRQKKKKNIIALTRLFKTYGGDFFSLQLPKAHICCHRFTRKAFAEWWKKKRPTEGKGGKRYLNVGYVCVASNDKNWCCLLERE